MSTIIDADVLKCFDNLPHKEIHDILRKRVNDGKIHRFIGKWLNAGVVEKDNIHYPSCGSPQGGCISPLIANIFLHHVLDEWYEKEVEPRLKGKSFLVRFADDFVMGCQSEADGVRVMDVLPKRFAKYGLSIHPEKSKMVRFSWSTCDDPTEKNGTFDYLRFTHYWARARSGNWVIKRKTMRKRQARAMRNLFVYCRNEKHKPIKEQYKNLCSKLHGLYNYYGIICNYRMLLMLYEHTRNCWRRWLGRRTRDGYISWAKFEKFLGDWVLPKPRITKNV